MKKIYVFISLFVFACTPKGGGDNLQTSENGKSTQSGVSNSNNVPEKTTEIEAGSKNKIESRVKDFVPSSNCPALSACHLKHVMAEIGRRLKIRDFKYIDSIVSFPLTYDHIVSENGGDAIYKTLSIKNSSEIVKYHVLADIQGVDPARSSADEMKIVKIDIKDEFCEVKSIRGQFGVKLIFKINKKTKTFSLVKVLKD
ncbi:hypothetical protein KKF34_10185 [Myxococcota bacterium]|nr:hypothetical protein [Myxococcota bacterium]MBU1380417.1 hypothetical protein [Myxococcota bacterium]MBU1497233.1 hypothetical protein [Myxococcota bacterium]